jgi:hypothetical protein
MAKLVAVLLGNRLTLQFNLYLQLHAMLSMKNCLAIVILAGIIVITVGCSAPHDNPLDPKSEFYVPPAPPYTPPGFEAHVRSVHISRNFPTTDSYSLMVEAWSDESAAIDSVWITYRDQPPVALSWTTQDIWAALFSASYFGDPRLGSVIGQPFVFIFRTNEDSSFAEGPVYLFRVIEKTPQLISPIHGSTDSSYPLLSWEPYEAGFPFDYRAVVILTVEQQFETIVWTSELLSSIETEVQVSDSLVNGDYYWTLSMIDSFKNSSRSKEAEFTVITGNF